jgi:tellurite methyltransferase
MPTPASSVARYARFFGLSEVRTVLDYGAGTLRNALYLVEHGFTVYAADLPAQVKVLRRHPCVPRLAGLLEVRDLERSRLEVDLVLSNYVFNVIDRRSDRQRYLENVVSNLGRGGYLLMEVSCGLPEAEGETACDRYFNCDHRARVYTHYQLDSLLAPYGFGRICHNYSDHALACIYRLDHWTPGEPV